MKARRSKPVRKPGAEAWARVANGGGGKSPPPKARAASGGRDPWSLTRAFNKAAKPQGRATSEAAKRRVSLLRQQMQTAAQAKRDKKTKRAKPITSQKAIDALRRRLSQPKTTLEMTPMGSVTRGINPQRDRAIRQEMQRMQTELGQAKGKAKGAFNKAARKR